MSKIHTCPNSPSAWLNPVLTGLETVENLK